MDDLVIRDASIVDGTGRKPYNGDVLVRDGVIAQVGGKAPPARQEIKANGCLVTPGFVDVHTHYDAQIDWDASLTPSPWHGVTTVVMGNCGVGFAPVRASDRDSLIDLMEGVEEIPGESLRAGLKCDWETFPQFLDALERRKWAIDIGTQIPHGPLRVYAMGGRGFRNEAATPEDLDRMSQMVREGMRAGALGLTGTRSENHRTLDGRTAPGFRLSVEEMIALGRAVGEAGCGGLIGLIVDMTEDFLEREVGWLRRMQRASGVPVWILLNQVYQAPHLWEGILEAFKQSTAAGEPLFGQSASRPIGTLLGLTSSRNPFFLRPSYQAIAHLPLDERVRKLSDPAFRKQLLAETAEYPTESMRTQSTRFDRMFRLGDPPDYEPAPETSIDAMARAQGRDPAELCLDMMLERDGQELFLLPMTNYVSGDMSVTLAMMKHPNIILGLGDAGAHVSRVCDASGTTFALTHWARDRKRGPRLPLEEIVRLQTQRTAAFFGMEDRGVLAPGRKADLNVIDFERLRLHAPEMVYDQPGGAQRLVQRADGYVATIVSGSPIYRDGEGTGEMPGKLVRGVRDAAGNRRMPGGSSGS